MPVANISSNVNLNTFVDAARNAGDDNAVLKVSGNTVQRTDSRFTLASTHRNNMSSFLGALRAKYGDHIADMASSMLATPMAQGKPLKAFIVKDVVAFAEQEKARMNEATRAGFEAFITGADGQEPSLDEHVDMFAASVGGVSEESRAVLKECIAHELRDAVDRGVFAQAKEPPSPRELLMQATFGEGPLAELKNIAMSMGSEAVAEAFRLSNANEPRAAVQAAVEMLFPAPGNGETYRLEPSPEFLADCVQADQPDVDTPLLNPKDFKAVAERAMNEVKESAAQEGRVPSVKELLTAGHAAIAQELETLQHTLEEIDRLPEPAEGKHTRRGTFTQAQKSIMKEAAQRYNLHDLTSLTALMEGSRANIDPITKLAAPLAMAGQLAGGVETLVTRYQRETLPHLGENGPDSGVALRVMVEMAMRNANFTPEQTAHLAANLNSGVATTVAGAFLMAAQNGNPSVPEEHQASARLAHGMMLALHTTANVLANGNAAVNASLFTEATPLHKVPGGENGAMESLERMLARGNNPTLGAALALSNHRPPFSEAQWNVLLPIGEKVAQGPNRDMTAKWVGAAGADILAAQRSNGDRPLNNGQIWQAITGFSMPRGVTDANFGERLHDAFVERYRTAYSAAYRAATSTEPSPRDMEGNLGAASGIMAVSPRRMLELLARPEKLTLADVCNNLEMTTLADYDPRTAYGLVTDFRRSPPQTHLVFENAQGSGHSIRPFEIADSDNTPDNPTFQTMIGWARELTHGREVQTARVMQAFSQASRVLARQLAPLFPGRSMHEHSSSYEITAREQTDGSVVVDVASSNPSNSTPLDFRVQYTINTDGSHQCTAFEIGPWASSPN